MYSIYLLLSFILLNVIHVRATDYYQGTLTSTTSTGGPLEVDFYLAVDSGIVNGVYLSSFDFDALANNRIIGIGGFASNDNIFDYSLANYGLDDGGISFTLLDGTKFNFYLNSYVQYYIDGYDTQAQVVISPTLYSNPTQYYQVAIGGDLVVYLAADNCFAVGVYLTLSDLNSLTNNVIIGYLGFDSNDNLFDYTSTNYGLTNSGISFTLPGGVSFNIYYNSGFQYDNGASAGPVDIVISLISWPGTASPTSTPTANPTSTPTLNPTAPPTDYYQGTLTSTTSTGGPLEVDFYLAVDSGIVDGVYLSSFDFDALANNRIISIGDYQGNDNIFDYSSSNYGIQAGGISFTLLDGTKFNIYNNGVVQYITDAYYNQAQLVISPTLYSNPIQYYQVAIGEGLSVYLAADNRFAVGVYLTLSDLNSLTNNVIIGYQGFQGNDNLFDYTSATYNLDNGGISFTLPGGVQFNIYYQGGFQYYQYGSSGPVDIVIDLISWPGTASPTSTVVGCSLN